MGKPMDRRTAWAGVKRHPAFQDLSRDHFTALNRSLQVVRAVEGHPAAWPLPQALAAFEALWTRHGLRQHFLEEEADLVPVLEARPAGQPLAQRMRAEHDDLRRRFGALAASSPAEAAEAARRLTAHARWEEDVVFGWLQAELAPEELEALLARSQAFRAANGLPVNPPKRL